MKKYSKWIGDRAFYRHVLAVALPIMLQTGITNFVNMLDNIMVGRVGTVQMTGVAVANQLIFVYQLCLFGAVSGAGIFGVQFFGKNDHEGLRHTFRFKVLLCSVLTIAAAGIFWFFGEGLASLFLQGEGSAADAAASLMYARDYLRIMLIGFVPTAIVQLYASTLRETGERVVPMSAGLAAVLVNLALNALLIFGYLGFPKLGVYGAAIATVVARFVEMTVVMIWTHRHKQKNAFIVGVYRSMYIPRRLIGQMMIKGTPLLINEALWSLGMTMLNRCYSIRGLDVVAAINISQTFWNVFSVTFMAIGTAIGIIVGQLLGAERFEEAKDTDRKLIAFSLMVSVAVALIYGICSRFIPLFYNTTDSVRQLATGIMTIGACMMPLNALTHASYFTLRSGGKTGITFVFDSGFVWAISVPVALALTTFTTLPIFPLYLCCQSLEIIKCVIGGVMIKKGAWLHSVVKA